MPELRLAKRLQAEWSELCGHGAPTTEDCHKHGCLPLRSSSQTPAAFNFLSRQPMCAGACGSCHACPMHHPTSGTWQKHVAKQRSGNRSGVYDNMVGQHLQCQVGASRTFCFKISLEVSKRFKAEASSGGAAPPAGLLECCQSVSPLNHHSSIAWCENETDGDQCCQSYHKISPLVFVFYHISSFFIFLLTFTQPKGKKSFDHDPHLWLLSTSRTPFEDEINEIGWDTMNLNEQVLNGFEINDCNTVGFFNFEQPQDAIALRDFPKSHPCQSASGGGNVKWNYANYAMFSFLRPEYISCWLPQSFPQKPWQLR